MQGLLGRAALSFGDERHDVADLVLVGLLTGDWQVLLDQVARGLSLEAVEPNPVDAEEVDRAEREFRYQRRLISAAEFRAWLGERSISLADLEGVLARRLRREHADDVRLPKPDAARLVEVIWAEAVCTGTLMRCAEQLRAWHAGCDVVARSEVAGSSMSFPAVVIPDADVVVAAALAETASGLASMAPTELGRRTVRLAALKAGYASFCVGAVSEGAVDARLAEHRLDWTVVSGHELRFEREGAALETRLRVRHDGDTLAQVAAMLGLKPLRCDLELGDVPAQVAADLLAGRAGDLAGPWRDAERWRIFELATDVAAAPDERLRARARDELLRELVERFSAGKAAVLAPL